VIPLFHGLTAAVMLAGFCIGFVVGAGASLIKNAVSPAEVKVHYCYPNSTEEICKRAPAHPPGHPRIATRAD